jgi:hypothetical protein
MGASTPHNTIGLHDLLQGYLTFVVVWGYSAVALWIQFCAVIIIIIIIIIIMIY